MFPAFINADSGKLSCFPSNISLKLLIVSFSGTYVPGIPVNTSATWNGCPRNLYILLARATVNLSSSDNSSIPSIAIIS